MSEFFFAVNCNMFIRYSSLMKTRGLHLTFFRASKMDELLRNYMEWPLGKRVEALKDIVSRFLTPCQYVKKVST